MEKFKCKECGKIGTKEELKRHICNDGIERHFHDEDYFLESMILLGIISLMGNDEIPSAIESPTIESGGGDFSGAGASSDFGDSGSSSSDFGSSDSGSSSY